MSLIEQAARRLEQLRRAGIELPDRNHLTYPQIRPNGVASGLRQDDVGSGQAGSGAPVMAAEQVEVDPDVRTSASEPAAQSRMVEIDLDALIASGIVSPLGSRSKISEEYRVIKRPLIANAMGRGAAPIINGNLIMVTSALSGEGKSFTALNLAMSIASELDSTVMLVDADVARPSIMNMLGLPPAPGLLDVLLDDSLDLSKVLLKTNVDKLTLLPSGTPHAHATELLASDGMVALLDDMARRYSDRIILFDSPPLLLTTESPVLASVMGQVVVVVHAEVTLRSDVKNALALIEKCPVKMMMLNLARTSILDGYGYGYGYGYGQT